jgi:hypothetical protein
MKIKIKRKKRWEMYSYISVAFLASKWNKGGGERKERRRLRAVDYARQKKIQTAKLKESQKRGTRPVGGICPSEPPTHTVASSAGRPLDLHRVCNSNKSGPTEVSSNAEHILTKASFCAAAYLTGLCTFIVLFRT